MENELTAAELARNASRRATSPEKIVTTLKPKPHLSTEEAIKAIADFEDGRFKHIAERLTELHAIKGTHQYADYLHCFIYDQRGDRQGFPLAIMSGLLALYEQEAPETPQITNLR